MAIIKPDELSIAFNVITPPLLDCALSDNIIEYNPSVKAFCVES